MERGPAIQKSRHSLPTLAKKRTYARRRVWTNFRRRHPDVPPPKCAMLSTAVSSKALAAMAEAEGFHFRETLTGGPLSR